jgi:hypothetical protein
MGGMFNDFVGGHALIRDRLLSITLERHLRGLQSHESREVAFHIRLGDFGAVNAQKLRVGGTNTRIPMAWYVDVLRGLRLKLGEQLRPLIYSDGSDAELAPLLHAGCRRVTFGSAIGDLWALSNARVLVGSASTFSMWASFLGRMPVLWYPGQKKFALYGEGGHEYEVDSAADVQSLPLSR